MPTLVDILYHAGRLCCTRHAKRAAGEAARGPEGVRCGEPLPLTGQLEIAARKPFVAGMQVWNFADFAAVQGVMRVGGLNMKGVFTRARTPKMAAQVLREFWAKDVWR